MTRYYSARNCVRLVNDSRMEGRLFKSGLILRLSSRRGSYALRNSRARNGSRVVYNIRADSSNARNLLAKRRSDRATFLSILVSPGTASQATPRRITRRSTIQCPPLMPRQLNGEQGGAAFEPCINPSTIFFIRNARCFLAKC